MSGVGLVNGVKVSPDDPNRVVTVTAQSGKTGTEVSISYTNCKVVGNGSFGVVFAAKMLATKREDGTEEPDSEIAIKKVLQDKRFKNRELQIMRLVAHPNVVDLKAFFYSNETRKMKSTSTSCSNSSPRRYTAHPGITRN